MTGLPMTLPPLLILRHGETVWNREGRIHGVRDSPLTDAGRAQAAHQGKLLLPLMGDAPWHWYTSPQGRACATAHIAAAIAAPGVDITEDRRLSEIDVGAWTGLTRGAIGAAMADVVPAPPPPSADRSVGIPPAGALDWYNRAPGGEGIDGLGRRAGAFLAALNGPAVIVTHGITSRVLRALAQGNSASHFDSLTGGQGVVYRIENGQSQLFR
ncbi:MAG: histidine phosphatase family protein [Pseudomonadota bacterium]